MRRARLSLLTAAVALLATTIWLAVGEPAPVIFWTVVTVVWLVVALVQLLWSHEIEPSPGMSLLRRFSRLLFWS